MTDFEKSELAASLTDIWLQHHTKILVANAAVEGVPVSRSDYMDLEAVLNQFHVVRSWVGTFVK